MQRICWIIDLAVLAACGSVTSELLTSGSFIKAECCDKIKRFSLQSQRFVKPNQQKGQWQRVVYLKIT